MLTDTIMLAMSNILATQNITVYEGDILLSDNTAFDALANLGLFPLLLLITGIFLYKKIAKKYLNSQLPVKELQNRIEILETIIVDSVEISENIIFDSNDGGGGFDIDCG